MRIGLTLLRRPHVTSLAAKPYTFPGDEGLFVPQRWRIYEQTLALGLSVDDPKAFANCIAKALT